MASDAKRMRGEGARLLHPPSMRWRLHGKFTGLAKISGQPQASSRHFRSKHIGPNGTNWANPVNLALCFRARHTMPWRVVALPCAWPADHCGEKYARAGPTIFAQVKNNVGVPEVADRIVAAYTQTVGQ
jgi:hypothetical protein